MHTHFPIFFRVFKPGFLPLYLLQMQHQLCHACSEICDGRLVDFLSQALVIIQRLALLDLLQ